ncbi:MAG: hypothetical protein GC187_11290 [Alphaproteobacteria bacterium]|nr:hypothetical protein [Alphaproteobacteria bacterium]
MCKIMAAALTALGMMFGAALPATAQETPGAALEALYDVISGPVGQPCDWDAMRALFLDEARMHVSVTDAEGADRAVSLTVEDYIARNGERLAEIGFTEIETRRETFVYGGLASVLSAYEAIRADTGELVAEGVNVLTLMRVGDDWKIASIAWRAADADWPVERAFEAVEQD